MVGDDVAAVDLAAFAGVALLALAGVLAVGFEAGFAGAALAAAGFAAAALAAFAGTAVTRLLGVLATSTSAVPEGAALVLGVTWTFRPFGRAS